MSQNTLVFDVGKTNKKLLLYDEHLNIITQVMTQCEETIEDGLHYEALEQTTDWFFRQLALLAARYPVDAVSITTHGATIVCLDDCGKPVLPQVAYTTDPGEEFQEAFYREMGEPATLQQQTATPRLGNLLSPAKTLFFLKQKWPQQFSRIRHVLGYPQYFVYLLTGKFCAEPTYIGCHTYLWDFHAHTWSEVAEKLGVTPLMPADILPSWAVAGGISAEVQQRTGLKPTTLVTAGIHDSNASLLPYLIQSPGDFTLNSTGTWCVAMRPADRVEFMEDELGKLVFYNLNPFNQPVKTAIFMGGVEFDTYTGILEKLHPGFTFPAFDPALAADILRQKSCFILPSVVRGTGQFPASAPRVLEQGREYPLAELEQGRAVPAFFRDPRKVYTVLNISLALQSEVTLRRTGEEASRKIFTEGGFRKNDTYNRLLSDLFPVADFFLSSLGQATAFGAALLGKAALEKTDPRQLAEVFKLELKPVERVNLAGWQEYRDIFLERIR